MLIGVNDSGKQADLPHNAEGVALIGDPRNDVHIFVSPPLGDASPAQLRC